MKKLYFTVVLFSSLFFLACSKDFLKSYDKRIVGTWRIADVNRIGLGGSSDNLSFREGTFNFNGDGSLTYTSSSGAVFEGHWDIQRRQFGNQEQRTFELTAVDFTNQKVLTEFYNEIQFRSTNHFVAHINSGARSFVTHFRR